MRNNLCAGTGKDMRQQNGFRYLHLHLQSNTSPYPSLY